MHILLRWNPPFGAVEMDTMTNALVLLCKMRCVLFNTVLVPFFSISASPFSWRPFVFCMSRLVRLSWISFLNGATNSAIVYQTFWIISLLAKASNKPISLMTRLAVDPTL